jgi:hypothetical protein
VHEVREDETLWKLTQVYQVDAAAIAASNGISANTELQPAFLATTSFMLLSPCLAEVLFS